MRHSRDEVTSRLRLREHDYSSPGAYFVTLCTEHGASLFGDVKDDQMVLSPAGVTIESWYGAIPQRFPGVMLDVGVVMPNHLHAIIMIGACSGMGDSEPLPQLSAVIQWFKGVTTNGYILGVKSQNWKRFPGRLWQRGYYDRIVRSDSELEKFRSYIEANPARWSSDEHYPGFMNG